ncbi:TetR/AcrR family transcriptional regulator [Actibacterium pelagium]|uniref:TetR family transcriptional regulator n=1 Tax=Actibacterium pelagium TaxID=2029103 RepID=A0A917AF36_9RHOB|nr:TetR/AcrR family transcriptional regulator [Actibacterium pelagium]GGE48120.1 TetR family transcriptional regulator [Actibacterium pelagium]
MAGPKGYKREELLDRAIELFRRQGYAATSTAELVDTLAVNRKSMYSEFGSKQDLFEAALERYSAVNLSRVLAPIEAPGAGLAEIRAAFQSYAKSSEGAFAGLGCLMANTAAERAALDPGSAKYVDAYLQRVRSAFRKALENAKEAQHLGPDADVDGLADLFTMSVVGISVLVRAKADPAHVHAAARVATSLLPER